MKLPSVFQVEQVMSVWQAARTRILEEDRVKNLIVKETMRLI